MREAIGGNWLFNIVIFFVILFTGYLCLSINHTKAFNVKDDIVKIIERDGGFESLNSVNVDNNDTIKKIVDSLQEFGYRSHNTCPSDDGGRIWYGFNREGIRDDNNASFCIREISAPNDDGLLNTRYYQVVVLVHFYRAL